jgi:hypothetical protein
VAALVITLVGSVLPTTLVAPARAASYPDTILGTSDLIAYWPLTETTGPFADLGGGSHTATATGSPVHDTDGPLLIGDAGSLDFPTASDALTAADHADLDLGDGPFSIELWVRRDTDTGGYQMALNKGSAGYAVGITDTDRLQFGKVDHAVIVAETGTTPADSVPRQDSWTHSGSDRCDASGSRR